ncbi:MAG: hypothetical protein Q4E53_00435 [Eubacteriales bacterium]|nr:hypothetical protein [Eubacteriales bacterium]
MRIVFAVFTLVAILIFAIAITTWKSEKAVGFFTGIKPPKVKNVKAYNHAVAKIWFVFAVIFELLGLPFLWIGGDSVYGLIVSIFVMIWALGLIITYLIVEQKYKK